MRSPLSRGAHATRARRLRADEAGFDFCVAKPADFNVLITIVDDLSGRMERRAN